jgi:hypothetical protein
MKMLSDKSKRTLAVAGISVVCIGLIIGISYQFSAGNVKASDVVSSSFSSPSTIVVAAVNTDSAGSGNGSPSASASSQTDTSSSKTEQKIQPDVSKPAAPSSKPQAQGSSTNPSQKPSYSSKDTTADSSSKPSGGETKDGKVYLPGFGWVTNTGGSGKTANDSGDIHKQVGQMD